MELKSSAFKAYDIRGKFPEEVNEELAYRIYWYARMQWNRWRNKR